MAENDTKDHQGILSSWTYNPPPPHFTAHQVDISDIADAMHIPPPTATIRYMESCIHAAHLLGGDIEVPSLSQFAEQMTPVRIPANWNVLYSTGDVKDPWHALNMDVNGAMSISVTNTALQARNYVMNVIDELHAFVGRAKNAGFHFYDGAFTSIAQMNANRKNLNSIDVAPEFADRLVDSIVAQLGLLRAEKEGTLNFNSNIPLATQLSNIRLSYDGFGGSGQGAVDLMRILEDDDLMSQQRTRELLSILDFKKRLPRMIFTAHYSPQGESKGAIVGWKRMPDAAGYVLHRRNIFDGSEVDFQLSNAVLDSLHTQLYDYVNTWVLSFYEKINQDMVYYFYDSTVDANAYYIYTLKAYQLQDNGDVTVFSVDTKPALLTEQQKFDIRSQLTGDLNTDPNTVSPYPALAKIFLGSDTYDWVLAGVNTRAAVNRGDGRTDTRKYSYILCKLDFLLAQMDASKFVMPTNGDVKAISTSISNKLSRFGVSQVLYELMQETGVLYFFEGTDAGHDPAYSNLGDKNSSKSSLLATLVSAIDPETLMMDLRTLASNMPRLITGGILDFGTGIAPSDPAATTPTEIQFPDLTDASNQIEFLSRLGDLDNNHADLTTFEGLSKFMRLIRIFSDYGTRRPLPPPPPPKESDPPPPPPPPKDKGKDDRGNNDIAHDVDTKGHKQPGGGTKAV